MTATLRIEYPDLESLRRDHRQNLRKGRAFVAGATGVAERQPCQVEITHPTSGETFTVRAEAVWVKHDDPGLGIGVQFLDRDDAALAAFVASAATTETGGTTSVNDAADGADPPPARNVHERIRQLSPREREQVARQGTLPERVALERAFGASVWEFLLQNPQLSPVEVARICKNGGLPTPLLSVIVGNGGWLSVGEVQRALLGNPRVRGPNLDRVLRALSRKDLQRVAQQTSYSGPVRAAAQRLLKR
jgi:hypothetical protein